MLELRDYQVILVDKARKEIAALPAGRRSVLIVLPTGGGKTLIASEIIRSAHRKGRRALFLAHTDEIVRQTRAKLEDYAGTDIGVIKAGFPERPQLPLQVGSIQTYFRRYLARGKKLDVDLIFIDEAHRVRGSMYARAMEVHADAVKVGLTATPIRLDGKGLGKEFERMVCGPSIVDLIRGGYLVPPVVYGAKPLDLSGIKVRAGEYDVDELAQRVDRPKVLGDVVAEWQRLAEDRQTVAFAVNVAHSMHLCAAFRAAGVAAEHLDGSLPLAERIAILKRLEARTTRVVCNVGVLAEGWDQPGVSCLVHARPTMSLTLWLQAAGRVLRPAPGKRDALILDHAGNTTKHGLPTDRRSWALERGDKEKKLAQQAAESPTVKMCRKCFFYNPIQARTCAQCGEPFAQAIPESDASVKLVRLTADQLTLRLLGADADAIPSAPRPRRQATQEEMATAWRRLQAVAVNKGYKPGWAAHIFTSKYGVSPQTLGPP